MKTKLSAVTIVDSRHSLNGQKVDMLIEDGVITSIGEVGAGGDADVVIDEEGLCVSIGWMDMRANFRDPGGEWKEDLSTGLAAAARGGFTRVALSPDTHPPADHKGAIEYALNRSKNKRAGIVPIGALSKGMEGRELSEMYDMYVAGARGFGDDKNSLGETGLLHRALLYTRRFDAVVFHFPHEPTLVRDGQINEGRQSVLLGMKGLPSIAEEMVVSRDLTLLAHAEGRLHLGPLSSAKSLALVRQAKKEGLRVTAEVSAAHLAYTENDLSDFDYDYKYMPPLRSEENRMALVEALKNGDIDVISSDHRPEDEESKKREFEQSAFGSAGIETFFPLLYDKIGGKVDLQTLIATFTTAPRLILGMEIPEIAEGSEAELTVFSTALKTEVTRKNLKTKAYNVTELGKTLKGRVIATFFPEGMR